MSKLRAAVPIVLAAALAVSVDARQHAPAPPRTPTFQGATRIIPVYASVTDSIGRFVQNLSVKDFEVEDDGVPQPITQFTTTTQPLTAVVLLDGSRSMVNALDMVIAAADHFVVRLMPGDSARIGSFSDEIRFEPSFTSDRDLLAREVHNGFDLRLGVNTRLWDALDQAVDALDEVRGHRVVVVVTDGDDTDSSATLDSVRNRARRSGVAIYAILLRGIAPLRENRLSKRTPIRDFAQLTLDSGGGYFLVDNPLEDLNAVATEVASELHNQYVLGFAPREADGRLHRIDVRVRRPGLKARARQFYVAEFPEATPAATAAAPTSRSVAQ